MATYIGLIQFADQGIRNVKDTVKRGDAAMAEAEKMGMKVLEEFWTMGAYDAVVVFDANGYRVIDVNTALHDDFVSLTEGEHATVHFRLHDVLLKPGAYYIWVWLGRGVVEEIDSVDEAGGFHVHEDPSSLRHTQSFPGVYQCRFTHDVVVDDAKDAAAVAH